jgi:hypothetical protein
MGVPAFLLSILHRQHLVLKNEFLSRYPSDWLVWEPGPWKPARSVLESNLEQTKKPGEDEPRPAGQDAMCFQLKLAPGASQLKVGRATTNDLVINDLTVSREQFMLRLEKDQYALVVMHGRVIVDGVEATPRASLRSGSSIQFGGVKLTLLSAAEFAERAQAFGSGKAA